MRHFPSQSVSKQILIALYWYTILIISFFFFFFFFLLGRWLLSRVLENSSARMAERSVAAAKTVREHLEQFNLHLNDPERVIICRACQFALSGSVKCIVDHVVDKHKYPRDLAKDLAEY
jgi:hypothetical protein